MLKTNNQINSKLHLTFMFACPLLDKKLVIRKGQDGNDLFEWVYQEIDQIDHQMEWKKLKAVL